MERYWIRIDYGPWREVDKAGFVALERRAGFHNTMGQPNEPGTGGFFATHYPGTPFEEHFEGTTIDPSVPR